MKKIDKNVYIKYIFVTFVNISHKKVIDANLLNSMSDSDFVNLLHISLNMEKT